MLRYDTIQERIILDIMNIKNKKIMKDITIQHKIHTGIFYCSFGDRLV